MADLGRILLIAGLVLACIGGGILILNRFPGLPLGRLPGDFSWGSGDTKVFFPLATMIIVSIVLTIVINVILKLFR